MNEMGLGIVSRRSQLDSSPWQIRAKRYKKQKEISAALPLAPLLLYSFCLAVTSPDSPVFHSYFNRRRREKTESGLCRRGVDKTAGGHKFFELLAFCLPEISIEEAAGQSGQSYRQKNKECSTGRYKFCSLWSLQPFRLHFWSRCNFFILWYVSCTSRIIGEGYFRWGLNGMTTPAEGTLET